MNIQNLTGQVFGQYELLDLLGFGGMGVAYRARQRNLDRDVAVKVLFPGLAAEAGYIERFYREAKTAASLEHAHIVPVYDYGVQGDVSYVVMRLLTGGSLEQRITQRLAAEKPLPSFGEISELLKQVATGLDYAHRRGVIHRDIKPGNIMFDEHGAAYIVDFGIAKLVESSTSYTSTGAPVGTPLYMPPEQWRSETLTPAADQYALAVTLYQLMTGKLPFEATTPYGLLHKTLNEEPTPPQNHRGDVPESVWNVLERAMAKNPADRHESVTAMAMAFDTAIRGQTGQLTGFFTTPVIKSVPRTMGTGVQVIIDPNSPLATMTARPVYRSPVVWIMGAALLIALAAVLFLLFQPDNKPSTSADVSAADLRQTVLAELAQTGTAQIDSAATADARVASALTSTATQWTPTPSPNFAATEAITQTREAQASATQEAEFRQATTTQDAVINATVSARTTATQVALIQQTQDVRATSAQAAEATAEQQALFLTRTANAATDTPAPSDTPTPTDMPTATRTPLPTPSPTATPVPNMRAIYDSDQFVLVNVSEAPQDISRLIFEQDTSDGIRAFSAETWSSGSSNPATMRPGGCYQLLDTEATQLRPTSRDCPNLLGWFRVTSPSRQFWLEAEFGSQLCRAPEQSPHHPGGLPDRGR